MSDDAWWRFPLDEKQATPWIPPSGFDPQTGGRVLSDEELIILRKLPAQD